MDAEPGCCPQLTLPMPHPLWRHLPILANLRLLPSEPRARQCGPRLDSGGRHSTDSRHFAMTSIRGSAFSEVSMTGLGERVTGGRVRAAPVSALGGGSQAARAGTAALLCSSCTRVCTHAGMHTRTLRPLHTFVKIRVRPVNQHNMGQEVVLPCYSCIISKIDAWDGFTCRGIETPVSGPALARTHSHTHSHIRSYAHVHVHLRTCVRTHRHASAHVTPTHTETRYMTGPGGHCGPLSAADCDFRNTGGLRQPAREKARRRFPRRSAPCPRVRW